MSISLIIYNNVFGIAFEIHTQKKRTIDLNEKKLLALLVYLET